MGCSGQEAEVLVVDPTPRNAAGPKLPGEVADHDGRTTDQDLLLGEPAGVHEDWEAIRVISRGFSGFRVIVKGTQTHSSISDQLPTVNAVEAMANVLVALRR